MQQLCSSIKSYYKIRELLNPVSVTGTHLNNVLLLSPVRGNLCDNSKIFRRELSWDYVLWHQGISLVWRLIVMINVHCGIRNTLGTCGKCGMVCGTTLSRLRSDARQAGWGYIDQQKVVAAKEGTPPLNKFTYVCIYLKMYLIYYCCS